MGMGNPGTVQRQQPAERKQGPENVKLVKFDFTKNIWRTNQEFHDD